ncbi:MAG: hypothetical protein II350_07655 [Clostridia bacterium]|nr:hypothetical protein [Clostridia bacterium]
MPECKSFLCAHSLDSLDLVKAVRVDDLTVFAYKLVIYDCLFALAVDALFIGRARKVYHTVAGYGNHVNAVAVNAMLGKKLVKAVGVAGLKEHKNLALELTCFCNKVFGKVSSAEIAENKTGL